MSLQTRIGDLITAVGTDIKQLRTWITGSSSGSLTGLTTTTKTDLVAAINEVNSQGWNWWRHSFPRQRDGCRNRRVGHTGRGGHGG
jgi:hypothetical protein